MTDRAIENRQASHQHQRRMAGLSAELTNPSTSLRLSSRVGEEILRGHLQRYQQVRGWIAEDLKDPEAAERWPDRRREDESLARAEAFLLHALSTLPTDMKARMKAIGGHIHALSDMMMAAPRA